MSKYTKHLTDISSNKTFGRKKDYIDYNLGKYFRKTPLSHLKVLEIGPGFGEFESYLNDKNIYNIDIIDNDKSVLGHVSKNFKIKNSYLSSNFLNIKTKLGPYDFIFLMQVLEHLPVDKLGQVVNFLYNNLAPNGVLIFVVPNGNNPLGLIERYADLQHTTCFTEQSLKDLVNLSKIKNYKIEITGYQIPPYDLINLVRIVAQKILHFFLLLILIINGGVFFKTMTPNIMLTIRKNSASR